MSTHFFRPTLIWGFLLWLCGYLLGMVLFFLVPVELLGWIISPIGIVLTSWVVWTKIKFDRWFDYVVLGLVWLFLAVVLDYIFLVKLLQPADGYYKLDIYFYYVSTLLLPLVIGYIKGQRH